MDLKKALKALEDLENYLLNHEDDIAYGTNDFGYLDLAFEWAIGRPAVESKLNPEELNKFNELLSAGCKEIK